MSGLRTAILWITSVLIAVIFLVSGAGKLPPDSPLRESFAAWGYPDWFRYVVGVAELIGGGLLLLPKTSLYATLLLAAVMLGALGTHLYHGEWDRAVFVAVLFGLLAVIARSRLQSRRFLEAHTEGESTSP